MRNKLNRQTNSQLFTDVLSGYLIDLIAQFNTAGYHRGFDIQHVYYADVEPIFNTDSSDLSAKVTIDYTVDSYKLDDANIIGYLNNFVFDMLYSFLDEHNFSVDIDLTDNSLKDIHSTTYTFRVEFLVHALHESKV